MEHPSRGTIPGDSGSVRTLLRTRASVRLLALRATVAAKLRGRACPNHRRERMFTDRLGHYLFRLYLSWALIVLSGIAIVLASVALLLDLDDLYEENEHTLLVLLPVTGYLAGWVRGSMR